LSTGTLRGALRSDLARRAHVFEASRASYPAFSSHATALSVLGALDDARPESYEAKEDLTRALLEAYQASLLRVPDHRDHPDRRIVITKIGPS
jgi:hypothetical protein